MVHKSKHLEEQNILWIPNPRPRRDLSDRLQTMWRSSTVMMI